MIKFLLILLFALTNYFVQSAILPKAGCSISVNKHLTDPYPLLLLQNGATNDIDAFPLPVDNKGTINFAQGQKIDLACPGTAVIVNGASTGKMVVVAQCDSGTRFLVEGKSVAFPGITCKQAPYNTARYTGKTCSSKYKEIEIGFRINNRFIRHITSCFDDVLQSALYSVADLSASIGGNEIGYPRPNFMVGSFYDTPPDSVGYLTGRNGQRKTINKILGLSASDTSVIHARDDFFLSTGHYVPKADFVFGVQQRATFYYVNTAPQWQTFNGGNWNDLEQSTRNFASNRGLDLVVYTGSHGISKLPDRGGVERELYLWVNGNQKGIPVPAWFYKVVYDPISKAGVAFVGVNNPYKKISTSDKICTDVCSKINWVRWDRNNATAGYSYCCEVADLRNAITVLPNIQVNRLLV